LAAGERRPCGREGKRDGRKEPSEKGRGVVVKKVTAGTGQGGTEAEFFGRVLREGVLISGMCRRVKTIKPGDDKKNEDQIIGGEAFDLNSSREGG